MYRDDDGNAFIRFQGLDIAMPVDIGNGVAIPDVTTSLLADLADPASAIAQAVGRTPRPHPISGRFYGYRSTFGGLRSASAMAANTLTGGPMSVPVDTVIDQIALSITTGAAGGSLIKLMLYDSTADGLPGALLEESGGLAADGIAVITYSVSRTLTGGHLYYVYAVTNGMPTVEATGAHGASIFGGTGANDVGSRMSITTAHTYGAAPDPFGAPGSYGLFVPNVVVRTV